MEVSAPSTIEPAWRARLDHVCRVVDGIEEFRRGAIPYVAEGVSRRERVLYVGDRSVTDLVEDLTPLGDVDRLVAEGTLRIESTLALYEPDGTFDIAAQIARYRGLTEQALDDGYVGLRVAAVATAIAATTDARRQLIRYELAVDRYIANSAMSAMCAYDRAVLGTHAGHLCAVHPRHEAPPDVDPGFRLSFAEHGLRLEGEVDIVNAGLFALALDAAFQCADRNLRLDLRSLAFIDISGMVTLAELQRRLRKHSRRLELTNAPAIVRRCAELLGLDPLIHALDFEAAP
jgi:anti-anti-sigma factor